EHQGSQCGYCTPGFVMALAGLFEECVATSRERLQQALTGNLCRCTGYVPILEAGRALDPGKMVVLAERYPSREMMEDLRRHTVQPVLISTAYSPAGPAERIFFGPRQLQEAVDFK